MSNSLENLHWSHSSSGAGGRSWHDPWTDDRGRRSLGVFGVVLVALNGILQDFVGFQWTFLEFQWEVIKYDIFIHLLLSIQFSQEFGRIWGIGWDNSQPSPRICLIKIGDFIIWIDVWWFVWHVLWLESKVLFESIERKKELCFFFGTPVYFTKLHH